MPQPFKGKWAMSASTLEYRPKLAMHIGIIASMWTQVEVNLAMIVAKMLHAEASIAVAMYLPVKAEGARLAIMDAVAQERLTPQMQNEFEQLRKRIKNTGDERDHVIHGTWAHGENQDTLILLSQKEMVRCYSNLLSNSAKQIETPAQDYSSMLEYNEKDFIQIETNIRSRIKETSEFWIKLYK